MSEFVEKLSKCHYKKFKDINIGDIFICSKFKSILLECRVKHNIGKPITYTKVSPTGARSNDANYTIKKFTWNAVITLTRHIQEVNYFTGGWLYFKNNVPIVVSAKDEVPYGTGCIKLESGFLNNKEIR